MKSMKPAAIVATAFLMAAPAFAQTTTTTTPPAAPGAPSVTVTTPGATVTATTGFVAPEGYTLLSDWTAVTADELKGVDVKGADGNTIGKITDVELGGTAVTGLIADIGGFLGMGAHTVKLGLDQVSLYQNADKDLIAHSSMTKEALQALPEFTPAK